MIVARSASDLVDPRPRWLAVGTFDGVHLGHAALLRSSVEGARRNRGISVAVTFDPHPLRVLAPQQAPRLLTTLEQRLEVFEALGVEAAVVIPFTHSLAATTARTFVSDWLVRDLRAVHVSVGFNFTFGYRGAGDPALLATLGRSHGFEVEVFPPVSVEGVFVSSSTIRKFLEAGDVTAAATLLGRPFRLVGTVVAGDRRGRMIGFPTANLEAPPEMARPARGVYAARCLVGGTTRAAMVNIGTRPTFAGADLKIEAHLLDFEGDLYGQEVEVDFLLRLRNEKRFDDPAELAAQLERDALAARAACESFAAGHRL